MKIKELDTICNVLSLIQDISLQNNLSYGKSHNGDFTPHGSGLTFLDTQNRCISIWQRKIQERPWPSRWFLDPIIVYSFVGRIRFVSIKEPYYEQWQYCGEPRVVYCAHSEFHTIVQKIAERLSTKYDITFIPNANYEPNIIERAL